MEGLVNVKNMPEENCKCVKKTVNALLALQNYFAVYSKENKLGKT